MRIFTEFDYASPTADRLEKASNFLTTTLSSAMGKNISVVKNSDNTNPSFTKSEQCCIIARLFASIIALAFLPFTLAGLACRYFSTTHRKTYKNYCAVIQLAATKGTNKETTLSEGSKKTESEQAIGSNSIFYSSLEKTFSLSTQGYQATPSAFAAEEMSKEQGNTSLSMAEVEKLLTPEIFTTTRDREGMNPVKRWILSGYQNSWPVLEDSQTLITQTEKCFNIVLHHLQELEKAEKEAKAALASLPPLADQTVLAQKAKKATEALEEARFRLAHKFTTCQMNQVTGIQSLAADILKDPGSLEGRILSLWQQFKLDMLDEWIKTHHEDLTTDDHYPHRQLTHVGNAYLKVFGKEFGLRGADAAVYDVNATASVKTKEFRAGWYTKDTLSAKFVVHLMKTINESSEGCFELPVFEKWKKQRKLSLNFGYFQEQEGSLPELIPTEDQRDLKRPFISPKEVCKMLEIVGLIQVKGG